MFQSRPFVVQKQQAEQSQQPDLKTALQRAERYGHNIKSELGKQSKQDPKQTQTNQQSIEQTPTQLKREKMHALEGGGRVSRPVIQCGEAFSKPDGGEREPRKRLTKKGGRDRRGERGSERQGQQQQGELINFRTENFGRRGYELEHNVQWDSSTGNLRDLGNVYTRERVTWQAAPPAFVHLLGSNYAAQGEHNGLNPNGNVATPGRNSDYHIAVGHGDGNIGQLAQGQSVTFTMNQTYQYRVGTQGEWQNIPGGEFRITRRLYRQGEKIFLEIIKTGGQPAQTATETFDLTDFVG
jgi:hypothetical protein